MRTIVILIGMLVNCVLIVALVYLNYFAPRPKQKSVVNENRQKKVAKIAIISPSEERSTIVDLMEGFMETLDQQAQFTPEYRLYNANDSRTLMRSNIEAAIQSGPDLLVALGSQAAQMTKELTEKRERLIPTLFIGTGDPLKLGLVHSLDVPGNHLTGVSAVGLEWIDHMVDLLPMLAPQAKRVFVPYDPTGLGGALEEYKNRLDKALARHNYEVSQVHLFKTSEMSEKMPAFLPDTDIIFVLPDAVVVEGMHQLSKLSRQYNNAIYVAMNVEMLNQGATFAYGYYSRDMGVCAANQARQIIEHNTSPAQMPVDRMQEYYRVSINVDNARAQGVLDKLNEPVLFLMENGQVI